MSLLFRQAYIDNIVKKIFCCHSSLCQSQFCHYLNLRFDDKGKENSKFSVDLYRRWAVGNYSSHKMLGNLSSHYYIITDNRILVTVLFFFFSIKFSQRYLSLVSVILSLFTVYKTTKNSLISPFWNMIVGYIFFMLLLTFIIP